MISESCHGNTTKRSGRAQTLSCCRQSRMDYPGSGGFWFRRPIRVWFLLGRRWRKGINFEDRPLHGSNHHRIARPETRFAMGGGVPSSPFHLDYSSRIKSGDRPTRPSDQVGTTQGGGREPSSGHRPHTYRIESNHRNDNDGHDPPGRPDLGGGVGEK